MSKLYSVNYPSLRDNNILRRVLVSEVLFWAETLKKRWMETKRMGAGEGSEEKQQMTKWSCGKSSHYLLLIEQLCHANANSLSVKQMPNLSY